MAGEWPLIGREAETAHIDELLRSGTAAGVVLNGPAGVGKSRIAEDCIARSGVPHLVVRGSRAASSIPLGVFAPYLPPEGLGAPADYAGLRRACDALRNHFDTDARPILYVDDAHVLDDASAALLVNLSRFNTMFLVVTVRTGEPHPEPLRELWKDDVPRLDLTPLDRAACDALLQATLGDVDGAAAHTLFELSQGNPLYLRELVAGLVEAGSLVDEGRLWSLRGELSPPPRLAELIAERLAGLTKRELFVMHTLALAAPMSVTVMEELGWGKEWDTLEKRGLVYVDRSERRRMVRVSHPMYAEVARGQISTRRRDTILRASAAAVTERGLKRRDDARRVAVWLLEAGEHGDPEVLLAAARDARLSGDHRGAARFAQAAVEAGAGFVAVHLLGTSLDEFGHNDEAEAVLSGAEGTAGDDRERTLLALARSDNLFRGLARPADAKRVLVNAVHTVGDPLHRQEINAQRAMFALFEGSVEDTLALTDPLLVRPDDAAYCRGALQAAMIRVLNGDIKEGQTIATHAFEVRVALADDLQLPQAGVYLVALAMAQEQLGAIDHAIGTAQVAYEAAAAENARNGMAWLAIALARGHLLAGRVSTAMRYGREAAVIFGELAHPGTRWGLGLLALAAAQAGQSEIAEEAIADLDAEPMTPLRMMDTELDRARAWLRAVRGDLPRARAIAREAARAAQDAGLFTLEAAALHDAIRLGGATDAAPRLLEMAETVDGALHAARVEYARAMLAQDADALEQTAEAFEAIGAFLFAAESWNEAAIAHRKSAATRPAAAATQRAHAAGDRCEGARTPSLAQGTDAAVLTKREREIATLASNGLTNKEIAEALVVSSRTVENHLQRAFEKLGVGGRTELLDALANY